MLTIIERLAEHLQKSRGLAIQLEHHTHEMLVTLATSTSRKQAVKVTAREAVGDKPAVVCMVSRACAANHHKFVREALRANARSELGSLSLETDGSNHMIDVTFSLVTEELDFLEFFTALRKVASYADEIENRITGSDKF